MTAYQILDYGREGLVVIIDHGIPAAFPTYFDAFAYLFTEGVKLAPEHRSMAAAVGAEVHQ